MTLALLSLFLAAFSIGTTEFVVAGLLPEISRDLGVSVPSAGLLVTGYALGVAIGGPILSLLTSRFPRKPTILALMAIFISGHLLCVIAPDYMLLMGARIFISLSHGSFFGLAAIVAVSIVSEDRRGAAISLVFAGITVANIFGVPFGTFIGNAFGWRATFLAVAALAVVAAIAMAFLLPAGAAHRDVKPTLGAQFRVLKRPLVYLSFVMIVLMMVGSFSFFTYVAPYLTEVAGAPEGWVAWLLLLFGAGATAGITIGGRLADSHPRAVLRYGFPAQGLVFGAILLFSDNLVVTCILLFFFGAGGFFVGATLQSRILRGAREAPDLASTLISSMFNVGIAVGAFLGATALTGGIDYAELPWLGFVLAFVTTAVAWFAVWVDDRRPRGAPLAA